MDIWTAQIINQILGPVVTPWQIGQLPEEWIDAHLGLAVRLPQLRRQKAATDAVFEKARRAHPQYGKRYKVH